MNVINFFTKIYSHLRNYSGIPFWVLTPFRKLFRGGANKMLPIYLSKHHENKHKEECDVIVSFTSFPVRINNVWQVVECMLRQSYCPKKIILWLSKDQFPTDMSIPRNLRELEGNLFEIRLVEGDIRSHKKYLYALKEFPNDYIFLIDDDIYYPTDLIEKTWKAHLENPTEIICNHGVRMTLGEKGEFLPYRKWPNLYETTTKDVFFGSGGGTLIRSSMLYKDITNIEIALKLAPIADDIWLNAMVNLAGTKKILLKNGQILPICTEKDVKLANQNLMGNRNDIQIQAVMNYYISNGGSNPFLV